MKNCKICNIMKPLNDFVKRSNRKTGVQPYCKKCHNSKMQSKRNPEYVRNFDLMKSYGITSNDYNELFNKQKGCCAICNLHLLELNQKRKKHLCVDHNHKTGEIRGLLCDKCNRGIGLLQDNAEIILNAFKYLNK